MYKVLIPQDISEKGKEILRQQGYEVIIGSGYDSETIKREVADCDALIARTALYTADVIAAGRKLKVIARFGVGTDNIDVKAAEDQGVYVTIGKNSNVNSVSEHTIALMLACAKNLVYFNIETKKGNWELRNQLFNNELFGKTLGIIGFGAIGQAVARKAHYGLDMNIISFIRKDSTKKVPDYVVCENSIEDIFKKSDIVTIHVPSTNETRNMVNKNMFNIMKNTALLINMARGEIVNEDDLYDALINKKIAFAASDVFTEEPPKKGNKLLTLDNFITSPHNAGLTVEARDAMGISAAKAVCDVLSGRKPEYPINYPKVIV